jgi:hypothetical protein
VLLWSFVSLPPSSAYAVERAQAPVVTPVPSIGGAAPGSSQVQLDENRVGGAEAFVPALANCRYGRRGPPGELFEVTGSLGRRSFTVVL